MLKYLASLEIKFKGENGHEFFESTYLSLSLKTIIIT